MFFKKNIGFLLIYTVINSSNEKGDNSSINTKRVPQRFSYVSATPCNDMYFECRE